MSSSGHDKSVTFKTETKNVYVPENSPNLSRQECLSETDLKTEVI